MNVEVTGQLEVGSFLPHSGHQPWWQAPSQARPLYFSETRSLLFWLGWLAGVLERLLSPPSGSQVAGMPPRPVFM